MSLIDELGGYDCAKAEYEDPKYEDDELYTIKATGTRFFKHNLGEELLEYRRQNNIFEVGDLATHLTTRAILRVVSAEDSNKHYRFIKVEALNPKNDGSVSDCFNSLWFQLKHATDEEIKVGRRLDD